MKLLPIPSKEVLVERLDYRDGQLFWKLRPAHHFSRDSIANTWNAKFAGKRAGRQMPNTPYRQVMVDGVRYLEHRVIAALHDIPTDQCIDHKDRCSLNNDPANLRPASQMQNSYNSGGWTKKELRRGVYKVGNRYRASVRVDGAGVFLGSFKTEVEAVQARVVIEATLYGDFAPVL